MPKEINKYIMLSNNENDQTMNALYLIRYEIHSKNKIIDISENLKEGLTLNLLKHIKFELN